MEDASAGLADFEKGLILGILIGEGHFGGDGKQPQITLKMNVRHERLLRWLNDRVRWSRLYGPYHHDDRHYLQLMIRGPALRQELGSVACGVFPGRRSTTIRTPALSRCSNAMGCCDGFVSPGGST